MIFALKRFIVKSQVTMSRKCLPIQVRKYRVGRIRCSFVRKVIPKLDFEE